MPAILSSISAVLGVLFLTYVTFILIPFLRYPATKPGNPESFDWHFFIPCRDEEAVVADTITRARADFPLAHVWVIDDDSEDTTARIVSGFAETDNHVHLVQRRLPNARTGKGDALNSAYAQLHAWLPEHTDRSRVIITVIDADGEMAPNALDIVSSPTVFGDAEIGAAQISVWMKNRADLKPFPERGYLRNLVARWLVRMQDLEFRTVIAGMQSLRARTGTVGLGGNGQFTRLNVLDAIGEQYGAPWHGALLEDYELGVHVLLAGSKIKHVYDTHVSQEALPSVRRLLTQRTRWAQGNIQCVKYIPDVLKSPNFDSGGVLETCYYLVLPFLQITGMITFVLMTVFGAYSVITDPVFIETQTSNLLANLALIFLFAVLPFAIWGPIYKLRCEPQAPWWRAILWGLGLYLYVFYMWPVLARAFTRVFRGKTGWSKTRRNAEALVKANGSMAIEQ